MIFSVRSLAAIPGALLMAVVARSAVAQRAIGRRVGDPAQTPSIPKALVIGEELLRGPAPPLAGYHELYEVGVRTIVDLRAEIQLADVKAHAATAGLELVWLPISNTRSPRRKDLDDFDAAVAGSTGSTYVHCEAGEGRTGAIVAAHQVRRGRPLLPAIEDALAVGSLSFSQLAFVALDGPISKSHCGN